MKIRYYAVSRGRTLGIYNNWASAHEQITRVRYGDMRKFCCWEDSFNYLLSKKLTKSDLEVDCGKNFKERVGIADKFYALAAGRVTGLYTHWNDVKNKVLGFKNADWKIFKCHLDAQDYLRRQGLRSYSTDLRHMASNFDPLEDIKYALDSTGRVKVYVHGEFIKNGINGSAAGIGVWFGHKHPLNLSAPVDGSKVSNIIAQIQAVIAICRIAIDFGILKLRIHSHSEYMTNYMMKYWRQWVGNEFKNSRGRPVENAELLLELKRVLEKVDVFFHLVTENPDIECKEEAVHLAQVGVKEYSRLYYIKEEKY